MAQSSAGSALMQFHREITRWKAEVAVFLVYGLLTFAITMINRAQFGDKVAWITLGILALLFVYLYRRFSGNYFVRADERGISWRQNFMSQLIFIPWNYVEQVDFLLYEINFTIKESGQVVCFATSGLESDEALRLKEVVAHYTHKEEE
jgi:hypothetical protein